MNETPLRARAEIDLAALRANVRALRARGARRRLMAVVKSDAYGHGAVPVRPRRASRRARPGWAPPRPRRRSRCAPPGLGGRVMCWLWTPGGPWRRGDRGRHRRVGQRACGRCARSSRRPAQAGRPARVQLKADTGPRAQRLPARRLARAGRRGPGRRGGRARSGSPASGRTSPAPTSRATPRSPPSSTVFREMLAYAEKAGRRARRCGTSPTRPATLTLPESHFDLVRTGIAMYGISPSPELGTPADFGLRPVMTLAAVARRWSSRCPAGHGVSYGHHYVTPGETTLGLVPARLRGRHPAARLRHAARCWSAGKWRTVAGPGRDGPVRRRPRRRRARPGDEAVLFGPGDRGRADRRGLGAGGGHHRVRDRHPHRSAGSPRLCERGPGGARADARRSGRPTSTRSRQHGT